VGEISDAVQGRRELARVQAAIRGADVVTCFRTIVDLSDFQARTRPSRAAVVQGVDPGATDVIPLGESL